MVLQQQPNLTIEWEEEDELGYVIKLVAKIKKDIADKEKFLSSVHFEPLLAMEEDLGVAKSGAVSETQGNIDDLESISSGSDNETSTTDDERQNERSREEQDQLGMKDVDKTIPEEIKKEAASQVVHSQAAITKRTEIKETINVSCKKENTPFILAVYGILDLLWNILWIIWQLLPGRNRNKHRQQKTYQEDIADKEKLLSSVHSKTLLTTDEDLGVAESAAIIATQGVIVDLESTSSGSDNVISNTDDERQNERSRKEQDQLEMKVVDKEVIADKEKLLSSVHSKTLLTTDEDLGVAESAAIIATQGVIGDLESTSSGSDNVTSNTDDEHQNERSREEQDQLEIKVVDKNNIERSIQSKQKVLNQAKIAAQTCEVELENLKRIMDTIKAWGIKRTVVSQLYCPVPSDLIIPVVRKLPAMLQVQMNTHGVKLNMPIHESAQDLEKDIPLIVICLQSSRLGTDVSYATKGIVPGPNVAVLILHHAESHALPFLRSRNILTAPEYKQIDTMIDMGFLSTTGIYDCDMNKNALKDLTSFLLKQ